jgi:2-polyprenyl-3-methyl-5-hydroxy-6-metoxy-1,4-benzoquinol methylase
VDRKGFVFDPLKWDFHLSARDLSVNYVTARRGRKRKAVILDDRCC